MAAAMFSIPLSTLLAAHLYKMHFFVKLFHNTTFTSIATSASLKAEPTLNPSVQSYGAIPFNFIAFASLLQDCTDMKTLSGGRQVHAHMLISGHGKNIFLDTKLVNMYATCGSLVDARRIFDKTSTKDVFIWNTMIRGYARNGLYEETLTLYYKMLQIGLKPDSFTFSCVLKACTFLSDVDHGEEIHYYIIGSGYESDVFVGSALVDMYAKCGKIEKARYVFDKIAQRSVVSWNSMIAGCVQNGHFQEALKLLCQMQVTSAKLKPDTVTIASVLPACTHLAIIRQGKELHNYIIKNGFDSNTHVGSALVAMYAKCGNVKNARLVFDKMSEIDMVSWSAMITGSVQNGHFHEALRYFRRMLQAGVKPDSVTIASVLPACACLEVLQQGKEIHDYTIRSGLELDFFVGSALIDMYAKCGSVEMARQVFDKMSQRNVVSWNAMIAGYIYNGHCEEALKRLRQMQPPAVKPDSVTMLTVLPACAHLASLQQGKEIHDYMIRNGFEIDDSLENALIDMYAKCGSIEVARNVFNKMSSRNVVSWNAMIAGYGIHGHGEDALKLFYQMQEVGMKPDYITFIAVLSACRHAGLVDQGRQCFNCMTQDHCITPGMEHYACMVDLLGRAGQLDEAHDFIERMPLKPDAAVCGSFLAACRLHCNIELGECVAKRLFELETENVGYYVLLSNIYASAARWDDVAKVRKKMKQRGLKKFPGCSWIEVKNKVHVFFGGGRSHPQSGHMYELVESFAEQMQEAGYVPDTTFVLHDGE